MMFLYQLMYYLGYFLVMIVFMVIAILTAKSNAAWIWYVIGAVVQLLSMMGDQKTASINSTEEPIYGLLYFSLLILTAILIVKRYNKANS